MEVHGGADGSLTAAGGVTVWKGRAPLRKGRAPPAERAEAVVVAAAAAAAARRGRPFL